MPSSKMLCRFTDKSSHQGLVALLMSFLGIGWWVAGKVDFLPLIVIAF
ncbi:MAG TPA: hypothetical protein VJA94_20200 [Candidatus Angelobacter sp.]